MTTINLRRFPQIPSPGLPVPDATVLGDGEMGFEDATLTLKIGDGKTTWANLPSVVGGIFTVTELGEAAAPPTTGTYRRGDFYWNSDLTPGGPQFFLCHESGTPGVWVAEGKIIP